MAGKFWDRGIMLVTGCSRVSPGCKNCWSESQHIIRGGQNNPKIRALYNSDLLTNGRFNGNVQFNLYLLERAAKVRKPQVYAIWNDLYKLTLEQIDQAFGIMMAYPHHTYLIVTKRASEAADYHNDPEVEDRWVEALNEHKGGEFAFCGECSLKDWNHIWHITTTENQEQADIRIPHLLRIPGKRGIIIEPALEALELNVNVHAQYTCPKCGDWILGDPRKFEGVGCYPLPCNWKLENDIHQVIMGAETGHGARPMYLAWARSVRDQCAAAGVPFYLKSLGDGRGRTLDGVEHNELAWKEGVK